MPNEAKRPWLNCPDCDVPVTQADFFDTDLGWRWTENAGGPGWQCAKCKYWYVVKVTDDYEDEAIAYLSEKSAE